MTLATVSSAALVLSSVLSLGCTKSSPADGAGGGGGAGAATNTGGTGGSGAGEGVPWSCDSNSYSDSVLQDAPTCFWPLETTEMGPDGPITPDVTGQCPGPSVVGLNAEASFSPTGLVLTSGGELGFYGEPWAGPGSFGTLEVWATLSPTEANGTLMHFNNTEGGDPEFQATHVDLNGVRHRRGDAAVLTEEMSAAAPLGGLHHIVVTHDPTNGEGQIYIDGRRMLSPPPVLSARPGRGETDLRVASTQTGLSIHNLALYDTPLSHEQVAEHCRCGFGPNDSAGKCIVTPTLQGRRRRLHRAAGKHGRGHGWFDILGEEAEVLSILVGGPEPSSSGRGRPPVSSLAQAPRE